MQDYEHVTRHRFVNEQEQPLTQSEAEDEFDALIETQTREELPTMRTHFVWVPTNTVWRQQSGTSKSQKYTCCADVEHELGERTAHKQFRVCWFRKFDWWPRRRGHTRTTSGSSLGQSRGGDECEMTSSAGESVPSDGRGLDPLTKVQSDDLGVFNTDQFKDAIRSEIMLMTHDIKGGRGFITMLRHQRSFLDDSVVELTDLLFSTDTWDPKWISLMERHHRFAG